MQNFSKSASEFLGISQTPTSQLGGSIGDAKSTEDACLASVTGEIDLPYWNDVSRLVASHSRVRATFSATVGGRVEARLVERKKPRFRWLPRNCACC